MYKYAKKLPILMCVFAMCGTFAPGNEKFYSSFSDSPNRKDVIISFKVGEKGTVASEKAGQIKEAHARIRSNGFKVGVIPVHHEFDSEKYGDDYLLFFDENDILYRFPFQYEERNIYVKSKNMEDKVRAWLRTITLPAGFTIDDEIGLYLTPEDKTDSEGLLAKSAKDLDKNKCKYGPIFGISIFVFMKHNGRGVKVDMTNAYYAQSGTSALLMRYPASLVHNTTEEWRLGFIKDSKLDQSKTCLNFYKKGSRTALNPVFGDQITNISVDNYLVRFNNNEYAKLLESNYGIQSQVFKVSPEGRKTLLSSKKAVFAKGTVPGSGEYLTVEIADVTTS